MSVSVFRATISSLDELQTIGALFGAHILNPLIADGRAAVVAMYGPQESGKSTFASSAARQLPCFYSRFATMIGQDYASRSVVIDEASNDNGAMRSCDFGHATVGGSGMTQSLGFWPRKGLMKGDRRYRTGVDLLEHPPLWHLEGVDYVLLIRRIHFNEESGRYHVPDRYFSEMASKIAGRHGVSQPGQHEACKHPRAGQIISEMQRIKQIAAAGHAKEASALTFICLSDETPHRTSLKYFCGAVLKNTRPLFF